MDDIVSVVSEFIDTETRRMIAGIRDDHFDQKILDFANRYDEPHMILLGLAGFAIQQSAGVLTGVYPNPADAVAHLDRAALITDLEDAFEGVPAAEEATNV